MVRRGPRSPRVWSGSSRGGEKYRLAYGRPTKKVQRKSCLPRQQRQEPELGERCFLRPWKFALLYGGRTPRRRLRAETRVRHTTVGRRSGVPPSRIERQSHLDRYPARPVASQLARDATSGLSFVGRLVRAPRLRNRLGASLRRIAREKRCCRRL